ncbi:hypothetical protein [Novipirellula caenicola]|uniref:Secreted protein n=1 Tax=Novipirellula caenicola TaxID=1536901 RepID=A0ABP9VHH1_9BACT
MGKLSYILMGLSVLADPVFCAPSLAESPPISDDPWFSENDERRPPQILASRPQVRIDSKEYVATAAESKAVETLVDRLSEIDQPDYGFANWMSGSQFAPIGDTAEFYVGIIMIDHQLKTNDVLKQLVALGPKALPVLLERLADATPTKLTMEHEGMFGSQWYGHEVQLNLARPIEQNAKQTFDKFFSQEDALQDQQHVPRHAVTIGDVCFVIIGQIVNRGFQSSRYQPTACRVINSPTHVPKIVEVVRSIWHSQDPPRMLFDALLDDFYTDHEGYTQSGAALRLLYYFPKESGELIGQRIRNLDLSAPEDLETWQKIELKNGLSAEDLFKAVSTSNQSAVTEALLDAAMRAESPNVVAAAINANVIERDEDGIFKRISEMLSVAPPTDQGPFGGQYDLLVAAARYYPVRSRELFDLYRNHNTLQTLRSCIHALRDQTGRESWKRDFLASLLDDRRDTGWRYGPDYDRQPLRICDEAAKILANDFLPHALFAYEKNAAFLDQEIGKIKRVLAGEEGVSFTRSQPASRPADFPVRKPVHTFPLNEHVWRLYSISDQNSIWVGGHNESIEIATNSGTIIRRVPMERPEGQEGNLPGGKSGHSYSYYGGDGGNVIERDIRTGRVTAEVKTPFHDGLKFGDPFQIRNLGDVTMCGDDSQWLIACTADGSLHRVAIRSGEHQVEHRFKISKTGFIHPEVLGSRSSSSVLIEGVGEDVPFDSPLFLWDQSTQVLQTIEKAPTMGWSAFWGTLALNSMNGYCTVWNLENVQEIELPWRDEPIITVACNDDQTILYLLRKDGAIDVVRVDDGVTAVPLRRLAPAVTTPLQGSLTVCDDGRHLLWHVNPVDEKISDFPESTKTIVAIYEAN